MTDNPFDLGYVEPEPQPERVDRHVSRPNSRGLVIHRDLQQGSMKWFEARCGLLTASEMKKIITPTLKVASNEKERAHLYELMAQRINKYVEPSFEGQDILRGYEDEIDARALYSQHYEPVEEVGFITNDKWGFTLGYSPDGLVGDDGLIEIKSRKQKFQTELMVENVISGTVPTDFLIQCQTGMLVAERSWLDFISYSAGMPMVTIRLHPDAVIQSAIIEASQAFENRLTAKIQQFADACTGDVRLIPTERRVEMEMHV